MSIKMYVYVACNKSTLKRIGLTKCNLYNLGIYVFVLLLPVLPCRHSLTIPHKRSFYGYAAYILLIHLVDTLGAALLVGGGASGVCFINLGSYLYFTTFAPVVYFTFLQGFFRVAQPTLLFSYKSQVSFRHLYSLVFANSHRTCMIRSSVTRLCLWRDNSHTSHDLDITTWNLS